MKLILTQEVSGLGGPGDIVEVKDGYGRNFLVPRGLAMRWTRGAEKQIDSIKRARSVREIRDVGSAQTAKEQLEELVVTLPARAGDTGRLKEQMIKELGEAQGRVLPEPVPSITEHTTRAFEPIYSERKSK